MGINEDKLQEWLSTLTPEKKKYYLERLEKNPWLLYRPYPKQLEFHRSLARIRAFFGGNRSGKTRALIQEVLWYAMGLHPFKQIKTPVDIWVVSLDFPSSRDVVEPMIRKLLGSAYLKSWHEADKIIELTNSSTIGFKSVDSGWEKFQGTTKHLIAFDEEPEWNVWQECQMRVLSTKGDIILAMTPLHGLTWTYDEIYEPWLEKSNPDIACFVAKTRDNPYLDPKEISRIESSFYDEEKTARLEGQFVEFSGLIYKEFDRNIHLVKRFPIPSHWVRIRGIDPGLNNPTACVWWAVSPDNEHFIYDEYYEMDKTIQEYAKDIHAKTGLQKISYTVIDPSACSRNPAHPELKSVREEYAKYKIWTIPGNNDVLYGINAIKELLHPNPRTNRARLYIFDDLEATKKEIIRYRWDTFRYHSEEKNLKEKPKKVMDHCFDDRTEVLTKLGWKFFKDVLYEDEIATRSQEGIIEYHKPTNIINKEFSGMMFLYEGNNVNFCVDPLHNFYIASQYTSKKKRNPQFNFCPVRELPSVSWVSRIGNFLGDGLIIDDITCELLGFYLAEGCKYITRGRKYIHLDNNDVKYLLKFQSHFGGSLYKTETCNRLSIRSDELYDLMPEGRCFEKRIPRWFFEASQEQVRYFLNGFIKGDGRKSYKGISADLTNKGLIDDLQELSFLHGLPSNVYQTQGFRKQFIFRKVYFCKPTYRISWSKEKRGTSGIGLTEIHKKKLKMIYYDGKIYCVTVPNHIIAVRRNGRIMWSGQCMDAMRYIGASNPRYVAESDILEITKQSFKPTRS